MKKLVICLALCSVMAVKSQEKQTPPDHKFQIGLRYNPDQEADPFEGRNEGDIGLGIRYKLFDWGLTKFNAGVNVYRIAANHNARASVLFNPNITAEFSFLDSKFRPYISGGYAFKRVTYDFDFYDPYDPAFPNGPKSVSYKGGSANIGARYYFKHLYAETGIESFIFQGGKANLALEYVMVGFGFHF